WLFCLISLGLEGTITEPWVGNIYEFEFRPSFAYQSYRNVAIRSCLCKKSDDCRFLNLSLSNSLIAETSFEIEAMLANTRRQHWGRIDHIDIAARYMLLNDLAGDPISLTAGLKLSACSRSALHDISSFHHGKREAEIFLSIGKEEVRGM